MSENGALDPAPAPEPEEREASPSAPARRWYHYLLTATFMLFCVELGLLLVLLPWIDLYEIDFLAYLPAAWRPFFFSSPFRGAVSGLGFLNFLVALNELVELLRPRREVR